MIKKIAVIGTGVIGSGWIIRFLAHDKKVIAFDKEKFKDFIDLNFMKIENDKITISHDARLYIRNIAMEFDPHMDTKIGTYSKTI